MLKGIVGKQDLLADSCCEPLEGEEPGWQLWAGQDGHEGLSRGPRDPWLGHA